MNDGNISQIQASPVIKKHVDEFAVQRDVIRLAKEVVIRRPFPFNNVRFVHPGFELNVREVLQAGVFEISVYVPNSKTNIFELRFKRFSFPELFKSKINRYNPSRIDGCHVISYANFCPSYFYFLAERYDFQEYQFDIKLEHDEVTWLDCLAEWIGRSVNSVQFMIQEFESEPCALAISFMEKLKFARFRFTSSQCCEETV